MISVHWNFTNCMVLLFAACLVLCCVSLSSASCLHVLQVTLLQPLTRKLEGFCWCSFNRGAAAGSGRCMKHSLETLTLCCLPCAGRDVVHTGAGGCSA